MGNPVAQFEVDRIEWPQPDPDTLIAEVDIPVIRRAAEEAGPRLVETVGPVTNVIASVE